jgi:hypothetical protein
MQERFFLAILRHLIYDYELLHKLASVINWSFDKKIFYAIYGVYWGNSSTTDSVFSQIVKTPIIKMLLNFHFAPSPELNKK